MKLDSVDEILRFAIRKEADAAAFYEMAAERCKRGLKKTFKELAKMEQGHKKKLENFDVKKIDQTELKKTKGLGISEMLQDVTFSPDMSFSDFLRMAIKQEERSQKLYTSTAKISPEPTLKKLLLILAQEESTHKETLEKMYEDEVLEWF